ncbi:hypothetical protein [Pandoraea sp. B-6]|uniref:hypothetical protein n=1 Tax=Pandoraea sp. B-6 TaxID=1204340 RepID=UPI00037738FF|nr:hypothetical protein [Pandoraea sp. B-6]
MNKVDKSVIDDGRAVLLVAFGMLLGGVVAYIWSWKTLIVGQTKDWVDIATAIGTVGAVVAAVGIALRDARWRRETKESEAAIAWGLVSDELRVKGDELQEVLSVFLTEPDRMRRSAEGTNAAQRVSANLALTSPHDMLMKLASLPGGRGAHIARAVGLLPSIRQLLEGYVRTGSPHEVYTSRQMAVTKIQDALRDIEIAFRDANDIRMK